MKAVRKRKLLYVKFLLGLDVNVNTINEKEKRTALDRAMHRADIDRTSLLDR